jgi:hypothetical protein
MVNYAGVGLGRLAFAIARASCTENPFLRARR